MADIKKYDNTEDMLENNDHLGKYDVIRAQVQRTEHIEDGYHDVILCGTSLVTEDFFETKLYDALKRFKSELQLEQLTEDVMMDISTTITEQLIEEIERQCNVTISYLSNEF